MMRYRFSNHARAEMQRRSISDIVVAAVLSNPDQVVPSGMNREVFQSIIEMDGKRYLIRIVVERTNPATIVTVYRTSRIDRYWEETP